MNNDGEFLNSAQQYSSKLTKTNISNSYGQLIALNDDEENKKKMGYELIKQTASIVDFSDMRTKMGRCWIVDKSNLSNNTDIASKYLHIAEIHTYIQIENYQQYISVLSDLECNIDQRWRVGSILQQGDYISQFEVWGAIGIYQNNSNEFSAVGWLPPVCSCLIEDLLTSSTALYVTICEKYEPLLFISKCLDNNSYVPIRITIYSIDYVNTLEDIVHKKRYLSIYNNTMKNLNDEPSGRYVKEALSSPEYTFGIFGADFFAALPITNNPDIVYLFDYKPNQLQFLQSGYSTLGDIQLDMQKDCEIGWAVFELGFAMLDNINMLFTTYEYNTWNIEMRSIAKSNQKTSNNDLTLQMPLDIINSALESDLLSQYGLNKNSIKNRYDSKHGSKNSKYKLNYNDDFIELITLYDDLSDNCETEELENTLDTSYTKTTKKTKSINTKAIKLDYFEHEVEDYKLLIPPSITDIIKKSGFDYPLIYRWVSKIDFETNTYKAKNMFKTYSEELEAIKQYSSFTNDRMPRKRFIWCILASRIIAMVLKNEFRNDANVVGEYLPIELSGKLSTSTNKENTNTKYTSIEETKAKKNLFNDMLTLKTNLLQHQRNGAKWLSAIEQSDLDYLLPNSIYCKSILGYNNQYTNLLDNKEYKADEIKLIKGGILADEMGLGKTIQILSAIMMDPISINHANNYAHDYYSDAELFKLDNYGFPVELAPSKKPKLVEFDENGNRLACTLIVCPVSLIGEWKKMIRETTNICENAIIEYHGLNRKKYSRSELARALIIITSYNTLSVDSSSATSDLHKLHWRRLIFDEGHLIKNISTKKAQSAKYINADIRWFVSGTPMQNSLDEFFTTLDLVGITISENIKFDEMNEKEIIHFLYLIRTYMLRRNKSDVFKTGNNIVGQNITWSSQLSLPTKHIVQHTLKMSEDEQYSYSLFQSASQHYISNLENGGTWMQINAIIMHLRLLCCSTSALGSKALNFLNVIRAHSTIHGTTSQVIVRKASIAKDLLKSDRITELLSINEKVNKSNRHSMSNENSTICPICLIDAPNVVTVCNHLYHNECIVEWIEKEKICPICRKNITDSDIIKIDELNKLTTAYYKSEEKLKFLTLNSEIDIERNTKIKFVADFINRLIMNGHDENVAQGPVKVIVYSNFTRVLKLLILALDKRLIPHLLLTGEVTNANRTQLINQFQGTLKSTVLLCTYSTAAVGLNLTEANHVFLIDPWWNPFQEDQAIDRVHRIGQYRPVYIYKIIMENTVETKILECQNNKRILAQKIVGLASANVEQSNLSTLELKKLIDLDE